MNDPAHKDVHDKTMQEFAERRELLKQLLSKLEHETLVEEMEAFISYVEKEVLTHEEEASEYFYKTLAQEKPELKEKVQHLTRDYQLIRIMLDLMRKELSNKEIDFQKLVDYSSAVTLINEIHSKDEEESLLKND